MAMLGGRYGDGAGASATAAALATVAGTTAQDLVQVLLKADDDNTGSIYVGASTVAANGSTGAHMRLKAGQSVTLGPGSPFQADLTATYVRGSDGNQTCWVQVITGGSRSTVAR